MSEAKRSGEKGRGVLREIFGGIPLPRSVRSFDPDYDDYWAERISSGVVTTPALRRARSIERFVSQGDTLLDVGCGTGESLEYFRDNCKAVCSGVDISRRALESVSDKGFPALSIDLTSADAGFQGEFDHIVLFELLEHVVDAETLLLNLRGRFRKGLYVSTPNLGYIAHRLRLIFGRFPVTYIDDPREHVRFWTVRDFIDWSSWLGFARPDVLGTRGKVHFLGLPSSWPSLWASEVIYRFPPS